jgi:hypothetical protein
LWVGSDRGIVARLDLATNRFEPVTSLQGRRIARIAAQDDRIVAVGRPAERGCLPVQLEGKVPSLDCDAATSEDKTWKPVQPARLPSARAAWRIDGKTNFLDRIDPETGKPARAYYLTGVFQPRVLCASPDGRRVWLATYSGLVRIDHQP